MELHNTREMRRFAAGLVTVAPASVRRATGGLYCLSAEISAVQHRLLSQPLPLVFSTVGFGFILRLLSKTLRGSQRLSEALRGSQRLSEAAIKPMTACCVSVPLQTSRQSFIFPVSSKGHNKRTPADAGVLEYRYLMESYLSGRSLANCRKFTAIT